MLRAAAHPQLSNQRSNTAKMNDRIGKCGGDSGICKKYPYCRFRTMFCRSSHTICFGVHPFPLVFPPQNHNSPTSPSMPLSTMGLPFAFPSIGRCLHGVSSLPRISSALLSLNPLGYVARTFASKKVSDYYSCRCLASSAHAERAASIEGPLLR